MRIHNAIMKTWLLAGCAGVAFALGAGAVQAGTAGCAPAVAKHSAAQPGRVSLLERDAGYAPMQLAFNPTDAADLLVVEDDGIIHRLRIAPTGTAQVEVIRSAVPISSAAFSPHGHRIAMGRADGTVSLLDELHPGRSRMLKGPKGRVLSLAFSADGRRLAAEGLDDAIHLWSGPNLMPEAALHGAPLADVIRYSPNGANLGVGTYNGLFVFSQQGAGTARAMGHSVHGGPFLDVSFTPRSGVLHAAQAGGLLSRWSPHSNAWNTCRMDTGAEVTAMSFSPDGSRIAVGYLDGTVIESRIAGKLAHTRTLHVTKAPIRALAFAPTGSALAVASLDGTVRLWRMAQ